MNGCFGGCSNGQGGSEWLWIIILLLFCGNGSFGGGNNCGCGNNCGGGDNGIFLILILLLFCGGCGGNNNCGCIDRPTPIGNC